MLEESVDCRFALADVSLLLHALCIIAPTSRKSVRRYRFPHAVLLDVRTFLNIPTLVHVLIPRFPAERLSAGQRAVRWTDHSIPRCTSVKQSPLTQDVCLRFHFKFGFWLGY